METVGHNPATKMLLDFEWPWLKVKVTTEQICFCK